MALRRAGVSRRERHRAARGRGGAECREARVGLRVDALAARAGVAPQLEHAGCVDARAEGDRRRRVPKWVPVETERRVDRALRAGRRRLRALRVCLGIFYVSGGFARARSVSS